MSDSEEKRTKFVSLRLTPSEHAHLEQVAKGYGKPVGEIVRMSTFGQLAALESRRAMQKHRPKRLDDEQFAKLHKDVQLIDKYVGEIWKYMVHIDNNVNQVAKAANTTGKVEGAQVERLTKDVGKLKQVVKNVKTNFAKDVMKLWQHLT